MVKAYCDRCDNTGLIPFVDKQGKIVPHAWVTCPCQETVPEHYRPEPMPDDYDFPLSYAWRSFYEEQATGKALPPIDLEPQPNSRALPQEIIHRHSDMGKEEFDLLQQTARKLDYLERKLAERELPKTPAKRFGYKGIK